MAPRISSWPAWSNISSTDTGISSADDWIEAHRKEDGADGLWRIHNGLYDLGQWIHMHPGGPQWLDITRYAIRHYVYTKIVHGTDITELFETYHINAEAATRAMRKFYVRPAKSPRASPFTFEPDGFYNVLKSRVGTELSAAWHGIARPKSTLVVDTCFLVLMVLCVAVARTQDYALALLAGTVASHNFTHLKDNWRMYYMQLSFLSVRDGRIDWGLHQMETSTERNEPIDNFFITMVTFGDHTLHHLFPALDHGVIPLLQDTFKYTCEEFGLDMTRKPFASIVRGQFKQLVRTTPSAKKKIA